MPELPEVETIVRGLRDGRGRAPPLSGQTIQRLRTSWPRHIIRPSLSTFRRKVRSQRIQAISRRGKFIVMELQSASVLIHLMMSGDLRMAKQRDVLGPYEHTRFNLESGWDLRFSDARKFGRVMLVENPASVLDALGPEPLDADFTVERLQVRLKARRRMLKPLLMDQGFLAGVGNIYADEALNLAGLHPARRSDSLQEPEIESLWYGIRTALRRGIEHNGATIDWVYRGGEFQNHFRVYGRADEDCPRCGHAIHRIVLGQRGTYFCPNCQAESAE